MPRLNQPNVSNGKYGVVLLLALTASCTVINVESPPPDEAAAGAGSGGQSAATGGSRNIGGSTATGGSRNIGVSTATGGASNTGGSTSTGGASATGGMSATTSVGGNTSAGGSVATGGTTSASSTTSTDCSVTTNLLAEKSTDSTANWIGGDPAATADNPCGVQGAIYAFSDTVPSATSPSPITGSPCASGKCCISGTTLIWTAGGMTPTYKEWGAGLGLSLGDSGGTTSVRSAYAGNAKGFAITTSGSLGGHEVRFVYTQNALPYEGDNAPFKTFRAGSGIGKLTATFSEVTCALWDTNCTAGAVPYGMFIWVVGGDTAGSFNLCFESITPIF